MHGCINAFYLCTTSMMQYELDFSQNLHASFWLILTYMVHLCCSLSFLLLIVNEYQDLNQIIKTDYSYPKAIAKFITFFLIHPMPWINHSTLPIAYDSTTYQNDYLQLKVNYIILLVTLMKDIIVFLRNFLINSQYMKPRAKRIKKIYSVNAEEVIYAIRCIFRDQPIKMFFTIFILGTAFFAFTIRVTQSNVPTTNNPFIYYQNCVWYILITTTTVGYGQIRLYTHLGFICIIMSIIFGSLCISSIIFILINTLTLNSKEMTGLTALKRVESGLRYKEKCKLYIRVTVWRLWTNYKKNKEEKQTVQERKIRIKLGEIRKQTKSFNSTDNIVELCQRQFDSAYINTGYLCQNNVKILNFINNHIFSEALFRDYGGRYAQELKEEAIGENDNDEVALGKLLRKKQTGKQNKIVTNKYILIKKSKDSISSQSSISEYPTFKKIS